MPRFASASLKAKAVVAQHSSPEDSRCESISPWVILDAICLPLNSSPASQLHLQRLPSHVAACPIESRRSNVLGLISFWIRDRWVVSWLLKSATLTFCGVFYECWLTSVFFLGTFFVLVFNIRGQTARRGTQQCSPTSWPAVISFACAHFMDMNLGITACCMWISKLLLCGLCVTFWVNGNPFLSHAKNFHVKYVEG